MENQGLPYTIPHIVFNMTMVILIIIGILLIRFTIYYNNYYKKYRKCKKLVAWRSKVLNTGVPFTPEYIKDKEPELNAMDWLIKYYTGRASTEPELYIRSLLEMPSLNDYQTRYTSFLYNYIYFGNIVNF